ncbi:MAG: hypothetical protein Q9222_006109 [Ikaeria aurantiellina]
MSCGLVGPDFMDEFFPPEDSERKEKSSEGDTAVNDGSESAAGDEANAPGEPFSTMDSFMAAAVESFDLNAPASLRLAQKKQIVDRIFFFAMQAKDNTITMPRTRHISTNADVAVGLLCVNENQFVVDWFGAGLLPLSRPRGLSSCQEHCVNQLTIGSLNLTLGSEDHDDIGAICTAGFIQSLRGMTQSITVKHLRIDLLPFCFNTDDELEAFAKALGDKLKVEIVLEMTGLDIHWELNLRLVPMALHMKLQPIICEYERHNDERNIIGFFGCSYEPAGTVNEILGLDENGNELDINDGKKHFERHEWDLYHGTGNES